MSMTKKDFQVIAKMTATLALADVPIVEILNNKDIPTVQILEYARVRTVAWMAWRVLREANQKCDWYKFLDAVKSEATQLVETREARQD